MKKREAFLKHLEETIGLKSATLLDIGCGDGVRTMNVAAAAKHVVAIDPNVKVLERAQKQNVMNNLKYVHADALHLPFPSASFDVVLFTSSFHHIATDDMPRSLAEALRVTKRHGHLVFLEPDFGGSVYEADRLFGTGDGDIRDVKAYAYHVMLTEEAMEEVEEFVDRYTYRFKNVDDFIEHERPRRGNRQEWQRFLLDHKLKLSGDERLSIFQKR